MNIPKKYTKGLTPSQKKKQVASIKKGKDRPKFKGLKEKKSSYTVRFNNKYPNLGGNLSKISKATGIPVGALREVKKKGMGAYYSSGSRPNQTAESWSLARVYSYILGGGARKVDKHITEKYSVTF
jgi:hypothetical protein